MGLKEDALKLHKDNKGKWREIFGAQDYCGLFAEKVRTNQRKRLKLNMKKTAFLIAALTFSSLAAAQTIPVNPKFGSVSDAEIDMTVYSPDTSAVAVMLYREYTMDLVISEVSGVIVKDITVHERIKVLKEEGKRFGDFSFLYLNSNSTKEAYSGVKVETFNRENGKVVRTKMSKKFDFDEETMSAAETIWNVIKKYQVDVKINYSEESTQLQQMIEELETDSQTKPALNKLGLTDQLLQLKTANEAVRTMMAQRNDERTAHGKAALATARKETNAAYHDLVAMLNAFSLTDDDPHRFDELISQVNELIKYYRLHVVPKAGKKDEEGEENGSESGSGSDDTDQ